MTEHFKIDISKFKVLDKIKSGGFSSIFSVQDIKTNKTYAAKIIESTSTQNKDSIIQEIDAIIRMKHPTIINIYWYSFTDFDGKDNITLIMQLATNGSLAELLSKIQQGVTNQNYDNTTRQKILIGIARGMMYLHQHHAIHCDLTPKNILFDANLEPHIANFGLSKLSITDDSNNQIDSTNKLFYMAPEVINDKQFTDKSDVFSFGVLMYDIITDSNPYPEFQQNKITLSQLKSKILTEDYRPKFTTPINPQIQKLIEQCWSKDPKDRLSFEEIYNKLTQNIKNSTKTTDNSEYLLDNIDNTKVLLYINKIENDDENSSTKDQQEGNNQKKSKNTNKESHHHHHLIDIDQFKSTNNEVNKIRLHVKICEAKNLISSNTKSNPLVNIHLKSQPDQSEESTDYKPNTTNPVWNEEFDLFTTDKNDFLLINVFNFKDNEYDDEDDDESDDECYEKMMDEVQYPINSLIVGGPSVREELEITLNNKNVGKLCFEVQSFKTEIEPICTFSATGEKYIKQKLYACLTCNITPENDMGICEACARNCHKGHDIKFDSVQPLFYCDCHTKCKCCCLPETNDLPCTSIENHRNPINQPMFYCKDCDSSCKFFICQNCAAKFHHGHDLIYLGIVEAKVCQNEQINDENI